MIVTISIPYIITIYIYTCSHSVFVIDISGIWLIITQLYCFNTTFNTHHSLCVSTFSAFVSLYPFIISIYFNELENFTVLPFDQLNFHFFVVWFQCLLQPSSVSSSMSVDIALSCQNFTISISSLNCCHIISFVYML